MVRYGGIQRAQPNGRAVNKPRRAAPSSPVWILAAAIVVALYFAREIFIPLAFALTLSLLLTPAISLLERAKIGRVPAVLFALTAVLAIAAGITWVIAGQLVDVANELPKYRDNIRAKIDALRAPGNGPIARAAESVDEIATELSGPESQPDLPRGARKPIPVTIVEKSGGRLKYLRDSLRQSFPLLGTGLIVLIFTAFMLIKREDLRNRMLRLVGLSQLNVMTQALDEATQRVSRYLLLQLLVNGCFGALFGAGLAAIGVPYAALWGVTAGLLRFVPYIGTPIAALLPIVLSLAVFTGWGRPAMVFGLFLALELVTANIIEPLLYGAHTGVSSLAILVAAVFWAMLWGPAGLILSTPLTVCVVVLGRYVPQLSFLHIMLGDEEVLAAEAQFYQRLLAMDQAEARAVADVFLKGRSLTELYDSVIIPALSMAEQDRHKGALDPAREEFIVLSISEMVAEFSATGTTGTEPSGPRVLCLPASDAADEITAAMLARVLHQAGMAVVTLPVAESFHDLLSFLHPQPDDVLCVSALPPFAFASARDLCRQIRTSFPNATLIASIWGFSGNPTDALARFEQPGPNHVTTSLAGTLELLSPKPSDVQDLAEQEAG